MQNRRQRLVLPFMRRRTDPVTWIYDHRAGVFSIVALVLLMAILFIGSKIVIRTPLQTNGIVMDLRTVEEMRRETERLQREVRLRQSEADIRNISNAVSNAGAELRDDRNTNMNAMREAIDGNNENMRGNRDAWEQGLQDIEAMRGTRDGEDDKNADNDSRAPGTVLVEFSLVNPLRLRDGLPVPGYKCETFGKAVVDITVSRGGEVVAAKINERLSDKDLCMRETALNFARRSRFNIDPSAPERHTGTITYTFVAQ